ncbi:bifunctional diguanylate cyclase/phosphodiesterase [Arsenicitalea aurantiaca]|uniref:Bifunctional diguanylate cyclase/phosphodiesterase n=1 Tax=Arsenicitalea aurantiaca TaxID=1783274 RepID=A0A433XLS2_9HYPH|nr:bifunctional diguanylate cyclase/phosphodiesterase [Arsenicitalea aurantiaca]RUT34938.1 bifunctional diguanylate cyclase/phosphodiesterase [Arsenicitalea aurantiaca]
MQAKTNEIKQWQLTAGLLAPLVATLLATAIVVIGFALWSADEVDARSASRQTRVVANAISENLRSIPHGQESFALWDQAVGYTRLGFDREWVHANLGVWMHGYLGHDRILVLDDNDIAIYASARGVEIAPEEIADELLIVRQHAQLLRRMLLNGAQERPRSNEDTVLPHIVDIVDLAGQPGVLSVMPIRSDTRTIPQVSGSEYFLVSFVSFDAAFAGRLSAQYMLDAPRFSQAEEAGADRAAYPVRNASGRFVTFLNWTLYRPGTIMLQQTGPVLAIAFLVATAIVFLLIDRLRRTSQALERGRRQAHHEASHDPLTGLPNRAYFDRVLSRSLLAEPPEGETLVVLLLDLDRFKQVNDTLGHQAGDDLIRAVGQRLAELVASEDMIARLGGDEFAIIHRSVGGVEGALSLADAVIAAVGRPFEVLGSEAFVGVSIGIAAADEPGIDRRELTRRADIALYEAKGAGRGQAVIYAEAMNDVLQDRQTIEAELREALRDTDQLRVEFQPLFNRVGGVVCGAEALARWSNPRLGTVSPARFIPVAESAGLIDELGEVVLRAACEMGAQWPGMTIAVNISPTQLRRPDFPDRVLSLLAETGMAPADLELEITESILIEDDPATTAALGRFRSAGIQIALDDFGTGYSSLNYLKRYPVDRIKIDRSFVSQLSADGVSNAIVQAIISLAHAMDIAVTAEGVETHVQLAALTRMQCNIFQGYLLSPPLAADVIEAVFKNATQVRDARAARGR